MKKYSILYIASALVGIGFVVRLTADYFVHYKFGSAPFYVYVLERGIEFLLPAAVLLVIGLILQKKTK